MRHEGEGKKIRERGEGGRKVGEER